jgi:hypothetical protein
VIYWSVSLPFFDHSHYTVIAYILDIMASGASPQEFCCAGVLFDMDGTIIDSTDAIVKHWNR